MSSRVLALGAVLVAGFLGEFAFTLLLLPLIQHYLPVDRHLSVALPGYLLAAYGLARLLVQLPLGALADAIDHRVALALGYVTVLIAGLAFWPPVAVAVLFLAVVAFGLGHALADPLIPAALAAGTPTEEHGRALAYLSLAQVAGLIAGLAGGAFLVDLAPIGAAFSIVAAANLIALLLLVASAQILDGGHVRRPRASATDASLRAALLEERVLYLLAVFFVLTLATNILTPDLSLFVTSRLHTSLHMMTFYLAPSALLGIAVLPLGGWVADRFGRAPPLLAGAGVAALSFAALTHIAVPAAGAVAAVFGAGGLAMTMPSSSAALLDEAAPEHRGLLLGAMMAVQGLAEAIGPFFGGLLIVIGGAAAPFAAAAVVVWLAIPLGVLYASAPRFGRQGMVVGYTPFTRALSRASIRAHAWYLGRHTRTADLATEGKDAGR